MEKATGRGWEEWLAILDKAGARGWSHREIAEFLKKRYKLRPWWQQGVAIGYETAIGKRLEGQNAKGEYMVTATKSMGISAREVWRALLSDRGLKIWLKPLFAVSIEPGTVFETVDGFFGEVRTMKTARRIRMMWNDPNWTRTTTVQITLVDRPKGKSIIVFDHTQIRDTRVQAQMRKRWRSAADDLASSLMSKSMVVKTKRSKV